MLALGLHKIATWPPWVHTIEIDQIVLQVVTSVTGILHVLYGACYTCC